MTLSYEGMAFKSRHSPQLDSPFPVVSNSQHLYGRLLMASGVYQHALSKKKKIEALEDAEKLLPIDTLGIVMITHGEEFNDNSTFGTQQLCNGYGLGPHM